MHHVFKTLWVISATISATGSVAASAPTASAETAIKTTTVGSHYVLDVTERTQHRLHVTLTIEASAGVPVTLIMPSSSPGRYARHDFAKNVYAIQAIDAKGQGLTVSRTGPSTWAVTSPVSGPLAVSYQLFANHADGTYSQIDRRHAHLNMPATLLYAPSVAEQAVTVQIKGLPQDWTVATQLPERDPQQAVYQADNLQLLMDSPIEAAALQWAQFTQHSNGVPNQIRVALHHQGSAADLQELMPKIQGFVAEQQAIFGELPDYANQRYTFLADYLPGVEGDGMEHRSSTVVTSSDSLQDRDFSQVETMSHEFFHAWNVERIRPQSLEPFDFTQTNMSDALWFAEGFTNYYGKLALKRSGYFDDSAYLQQLSKAIDRTLRAPGRQWRGPKAMSEHAVFVDAGVSVDRNDFQNNYLSYYTYGEVMALVWDLELRSRYKTDLDSLMRQMWLAHGKPERPYQLADVQQALATVSGDPSFADQVFRQWIEQPGLPEMPALLAQFGLTLQQAQLSEAWAGPLQVNTVQSGLQVISAPLADSPWFNAGINQDAILVKVGRYQMKDQAALEKALAKAKPGDSLPVEYLWQGEQYHTQLTVQGNPTWTVALDKNATKKALQRRTDWWKSRAQ